MVSSVGVRCSQRPGYDRALGQNGYEDAAEQIKCNALAFRTDTHASARRLVCFSGLRKSPAGMHGRHMFFERGVLQNKELQLLCLLCLFDHPGVYH